jgi:hypothetical protein
MGSSTQTATLLLPQFSDNDKPTWRGDVNDAMNKIDAGHTSLASSVANKANQSDLTATNANVTANTTAIGTKVNKSALPKNVLDYGATGDSATDDTAAITAAINAAGVGGQVYFPLHADGSAATYVTGQLTPLAGQRWFTGIQQLGYTGDAYVSLKFALLTGTQIGILAPSSFVLENMRLEGPGAVAQPNVIGVSATDVTIRMYGVQLYKWATAAKITRCYYGNLKDCEFRHNNLGLYLDNCYNLNLHSPQFNCLVDGVTTAYGQAIFTTNGCMVNLWGGSIEMFGAAGSAGVKVNAAGIIQFNGTYFETSCTNGVAIDGTVATASSITVIGCEVYIDNLAAFVDVTGAGSGNLFSRQNKFKNSGTTDSPTVYKWGVRPYMYVDLSSDNWWGVTNINARYRDDTNPQLYQNMHIQDPQTAGTNIKLVEYMARATIFPTAGHVGIPAVSTANRPTTNLVVGSMVWDISLGKPVWWNGSTWRDATGAAV